MSFDPEVGHYSRTSVQDFGVPTLPLSRQRGRGMIPTGLKSVSEEEEEEEWSDSYDRTPGPEPGSRFSPLSPRTES